MDVKLTQPRVILLIFGLFLLNVALLTAYNTLKSELYNNHTVVGMVVINEMTNALCGAVSVSLFVYWFWNAKIRPSSTKGWIALHIAALMLYSGLHTSSYSALRAVLYPAFGYGSYHPGNLGIRYAMELPNDVLTYSKWVLLFLVFQYYRRLRDREAAAAALEYSLTGAKLENLQKQMQPHFLMNSLNAISSLIYSDPNAADEMIARLGAFLRRSLLNEGAQVIPLSEEIASVQAYIEIMQMRYGDRLRYRFDVDPTVTTTRVPPLSLQPLVENSLKYGADPVDFSVDIEITVRNAGEDVEISVRDRGKGIGSDAKLGIGIHNLRTRMAALYGRTDVLQLATADDGGALVRLLIPRHA